MLGFQRIWGLDQDPTGGGGGAHTKHMTQGPSTETCGSHSQVLECVQPSPFQPERRHRSFAHYLPTLGVVAYVYCIIAPLAPVNERYSACKMHKRTANARRSFCSSRNARTRKLVMHNHQRTASNGKADHGSHKKWDSCCTKRTVPTPCNLSLYVTLARAVGLQLGMREKLQEGIPCMRRNGLRGGLSNGRVEQLIQMRVHSHFGCL